MNKITETKACKFNLDYLIPISILFVVTFVLSVAENVLVSVAIVVDQRRLRRPSNGYLLSLALTDMMHLIRTDTTGNDIRPVLSKMAFESQRNECF